jgi:hypothetical protein
LLIETLPTKGNEMKAIFWLSIALISSFSPVFSQSPKPGDQGQSGAQAVPNTSRPPLTVPQRSRPPQEILRRPIQQIPSGFAIPVPPDAKFVTGYQMQYQGSKLSTCFRYTSANQPSNLFDWYKQHLTSLGFETKGSGSTNAKVPLQLSAFRNSATCSIAISNPTGGKTTSVMIQYSDR